MLSFHYEGDHVEGEVLKGCGYGCVVGWRYGTSVPVVEFPHLFSEFITHLFPHVGVVNIGLLAQFYAFLSRQPLSQFIPVHGYKGVVWIRRPLLLFPNPVYNPPYDIHILPVELLNIAGGYLQKGPPLGNLRVGPQFLAQVRDRGKGKNLTAQPFPVLRMGPVYDVGSSHVRRGGETEITEVHYIGEYPLQEAHSTQILPLLKMPRCRKFPLFPLPID